MPEPHDSALRVGERVGRYRVVRELGAGGMGVVYEAVDEDLERAVALKVLPSSVTRDDERRARFLREARAAAAVTHRTIAVVHEVGEDDGRVFLAMELIRGENLAARIDRGALDIDEAMAIAIDMAAGLAKAHGAGVVHRDLKPSNVMLDEDGAVKLLDFGLAKRFDESAAESSAEQEQAPTVSAITEAGRVLGTPGYMAPEQAEGLAVGPTADVFAFGTTLYEMLAGRMAFGGGSIARRIAATLESEPEPLSDHAVPVEVAALVASCLAKSPSERPADGRELTTRLRQIAPTTTRRSLRPAPMSARLEVDRDAKGADATLMGGAKTLPSKPTQGTSKPWWLLAAGAALVAGVGWWSQQRPAASTAPPPVAMPSVDAATACPVFAVKGQKGPPGRLGAAAADRACSVWRLFSADQTVVVPAQLLVLPELPVDDFPLHPYAAEDARERSLAAAAKSPLVLDGEVSVSKGGFAVALRLGPPGAAEPLARATGNDRLLSRAVRAAVRQLGATTGRNERIAPPDDVRMVIDCPDVACAFDAFQAQAAALADTDQPQACESLVRSSKLLAAARSEVCGHPGFDDNDLLPVWPPGLRDALASMPEAGQLYWRAFLQLQRLPPERAKRDADAIAKVRQTMPKGRMRAMLTAAEGVLRFRASDADAATTLLNRSTQMDPQGCEGRLISYQLSTETTNRRPLSRAGSAWCPTSSDLWEYRYFIEEGADRDLEDMRTAYYLTDGAARIGLAFGNALFKEGRVQEARAIASRYAGDGPRGLVGSYLVARVEIASGRLDAGLARLEALLRSVERLGEPTVVAADWSALVAALDFGRLVGRSAAIADFVLERFLLHDPPALMGSGSVTLAYAVTFASPRVAKRSAARILELSRSGQLWKIQELEPYLEGILAHQRGDDIAAARAWRPLVPKQVFRELLLATVFDAADEPGIAWTIAEADIARGGATVGLQHALHAQRALAKGDAVTAQRLARRYVDAWGAADIEVRLLDEMRAILDAPSKP
jgi:predicted Ser/Thr protein kinase